jgi:carbonic anhydrase/acetyltransferase-like protein (isoleucine patch superfamily)
VIEALRSRAGYGITHAPAFSFATSAPFCGHRPVTVHDRLAAHLSKTPDVARALFVARSATVVGDVTLYSQASVFYGAVLRGDIARIVVGEGSNIQDNAVVHLADDLDAIIGAWCTIGHSAIVHACTIEDECLIGMGATVLDGARIGARSIVGAGALVTQRMRVPAGSLVLGTPAKVVRTLNEDEQRAIRGWAEKYIDVAKAHAALAARID